MPTSKKSPKEKRIDAEFKKLELLLETLPGDRAEAAKGMAHRLAFMTITLEDLEKDINDNGIVEMFTQSEKAPPYERERPAARLYNSTIRNYTSACKQFLDNFPKERIEGKEDELLKFISKGKAG